MPGKVSTRVVVNRKALTAIREGEVAGMERLALAVLATAQPNVPDAPPYGEGLVVEGDYGVWSDGRKVAGGASKPRSVRTKEGVTIVVGYPFPMRFYEEGTIHQPARPVLTPAMLAELPNAHGYLRPEIQGHLRRVP